MSVEEPRTQKQVSSVSNDVGTLLPPAYPDLLRPVSTLFSSVPTVKASLDSVQENICKAEINGKLAQRSCEECSTRKNDHEVPEMRDRLMFTKSEVETSSDNHVSVACFLQSGFGA